MALCFVPSHAVRRHRNRMSIKRCLSSPPPPTASQTFLNLESYLSGFCACVLEGGFFFFFPAPLSSHTEITLEKMKGDSGVKEGRTAEEQS